VQAPAWHFSVLLQALHWAPPVPQAVMDVPDLQVLFWQQPVEQMVESQVPDDGTQAPAWHFSVLLQALHEAPPVPHALEAVPLLHWLFSQQPLEQLDGPHDPVEGTQAPFWHF